MGSEENSPIHPFPQTCFLVDPLTETGMFTLSKTERLNSKIRIGKMFESGSSKSFSVFPMRVVFMPAEQMDARAAILVSVSKRRFKHAVDRNRIKRQIREAYRLNKHLLTDELQKHDVRMAVAFLYVADEILPTSEIAVKMKIALQRIVEKHFS